MEGLVCKSEKILNTIKNCDQLKNATQNKNCVGWYENTLEGKSFSCRFNNEWNLFSYVSVSGRCLSNKTEHIKEFKQKFLSFIPNICYAIVFAVIISLFFVVALKWSAKILFWCLVVFYELFIIVVLAVYNGLYVSPSDNKFGMVKLLLVMIMIYNNDIRFQRKKLV